MSDMADVLTVHMLGGTAHGYEAYDEFICFCGSTGPLSGFPAHQAAALSAAGFGPVQEARAEALEAAADWLHEGREGEEEGSIGLWLRERAAAERGRE